MRHLVFGRTRSLHIQFIRYLFVGGSSAVLDLLIYSLLLKYAGIHYGIAAAIGYAFGLSWNYVLSLLWIFESNRRKIMEISLVGAVALGGLLWTELLLFLQVDILHFDAIIAKIIAIWIVLFWNFSMRKFYIFR